MNLSPNDLIEWKVYSDNEIKTYVERILWISEDSLFTYVINVEAATGFPYTCKVADIMESLEEETATLLQEDHWRPFLPVHKVSEKNAMRRDKRWEIIKTLVDPSTLPNIFKKELRGSLVKELAKEFNVTEKRIHVLLRLFWTRGQDRNALLPDYPNSGKRADGQPKNYTKKVGRKRKYSQAQGVIVCEADKDIFRMALVEFYFSAPNPSMEDTYDEMIKNYYNEGFYYDVDGVKKTIIKDVDEIPTIDQLRYYHKTNRNYREEIIARHGIKKYLKDYRPLLGSSLMQVEGPGSRFIIDSTIANVYLRSRFNPNHVIGRAVVYFVVDVFSQKIAGLHVGVKKASYLGAAMALNNTATDKVAYCKQYGITITKEEWACEHIPQALLSDRAELLGDKIENFMDAFSIRKENAAAYRADMKGDGETMFNMLNKTIKAIVPGYVDTDFRERGARADYRLGAKMDIHRFTALMIRLVILHNKGYMKDYPRDADMIAEDVKPIPNELWNWGIRRKNALRYYPENIIKLNLLPTKEIRVTKFGIQFGKDWYYTCERAVREDWFLKASANKTWKITVSYDPRNMDHIYIPDEKKRDFEVCTLVEKVRGRFNNKTLDEIEHNFYMESQMKEDVKQEDKQNDIDFLSAAEQLVAEAIEEADEAKPYDTESKTQKIGNIRERNAEEAAKLDQEEAFVLVPQQIPASPGKVLQLPNRVAASSQIADDDDEEDDFYAMLARIQQKELPDGN